MGFAVKPSSVTLVRPFDSGAANISADGKEREVSCLVKDAKPKPEFKWSGLFFFSAYIDPFPSLHVSTCVDHSCRTIGDEELVGYDVEDNELADNTWMQVSAIYHIFSLSARCTCFLPKKRSVAFYAWVMAQMVQNGSS